MDQLAVMRAIDGGRAAAGGDIRRCRSLARSFVACSPSLALSSCCCCLLGPSSIPPASRQCGS